jgi:hypothetical protein
MAFPLRVKGLSRRGFRVDNDSRVSYALETTIDLDDQKQMRHLKNERGNFYSPPEFNITLRKAGTIATQTTASGLNWVVPRAMVLKSVRATLGTANTGATFIIDVNKIAAGLETTAAGTTVFTTQSRRPTIAISGTVSTLDATNGVPQVTAFAAGDIVHIDVDQVGSTVAGADLTVMLTFGLV